MWRQIAQTFKNSIDFTFADVVMATLIAVAIGAALYVIGVLLFN